MVWGGQRALRIWGKADLKRLLSNPKHTKHPLLWGKGTGASWRRGGREHGLRVTGRAPLESGRHSAPAPTSLVPSLVLRPRGLCLSGEAYGFLRVTSSNA